MDVADAAAAHVQAVQFLQVHEGILVDLGDEVVFERESHEVFAVLTGEEGNGLESVVGQVQRDQVGQAPGKKREAKSQSLF